MPDERDLHDDELEEEIELLGEVIERASQAEAPLQQDQVDQALGLDQSTDGRTSEPDARED